MSERLLISPTGDRVVVDASEVPDRVAAGYTIPTADTDAAEAGKEQRESDVSALESGGQAAARMITAGGSDVAQRALGGEDARRHLVNAKEAHPIADVIGTIGGAVLPLGATGAAARAGKAIATTAEGASVATQLGRAAAGYGAEGALVGLGQGVSELALSDQPLTIEHIASTLSSNYLTGGLAGAGLGVAGKGLEIGLGRAKTALDDFRARGEVAGQFEDDIARMDVKQLRAAREVEVEGLKVAQKTEREAIEAERIAQRKTIADDLAGHRAAAKDEKVWLATKGAEDAEIRTIGKQTLKADTQLRNLLDNPKYVAERPQSTLAALQKQEHALEEMQRVDAKLRASFAADTTGTRAASLDAVAGQLERNRALQGRIRETTGEIRLKTGDTNARLTQIDEARELLAAGKGEKTIAEQALQSSVYGVASDVVRGVPIVGPLLAPLIGARASRLVGEQVFGRAGKAASDVAKRGANAVSRLLTASKVVAHNAPPLATRVLAAVRYAPPEHTKEPKPSSKGGQLAPLYMARSSEIRSQTAYAPDGSVQVRPEARAMIADRLAPIAAADPLTADQLETLAVRRIEFLASKLPRRPDIGGLPLSASDRWQPSEMEMRQFARYVAAVEDPMGVVDRLADGTVTPSDTEVMRAVYPEIHADITQQVMSQLPTLRTTLPYRQRLALSRFTGADVDASMNPRILRVLQASFAAETGTAGGTQAPMPTPQGGSISRGDSIDKPTPAQERAG